MLVPPNLNNEAILTEFSIDLPCFISNVIILRELMVELWASYFGIEFTLLTMALIELLCASSPFHIIVFRMTEGESVQTTEKCTVDKEIMTSTE